MKYVLAFGLMFLTIGWAAFLVLFSTNMIVDSPPDFSEVGVGMVMMFLINQSKAAIQNCMKNGN